MFEAIISLVGGFLLHKTRRITERMPMGWSELTSYAVGIIGVLPLFVLFGKRLGKREHRCFIAYLLSFLFAGVGVALGWLVDTMAENDD